jgi:hypothetical protein
VSSEFGLARNALAADLRSRDMLVRVQSDFRQGSRKRHNAEEAPRLHPRLQRLVCVIGMRNGARPPPAAAAPFLHVLPTEFLNSAADTEHIAADMPNTAHCSTG